MTLLDSVPVEVPRDRWQRPLVVPPDGGREVAYTRCTTFVGVLEDRFKLGQWEQRQVAIGLSLRHDLLLAAAAHRNDRNELDRICTQAREAAKASAGATTGTALHRLAQDLDQGMTLDDLPASAQRDLDAYAEATKRLTPLLVERFTVVDDLRVGGTPDRVVEVDLPGWHKPVIADIKTGNIDYGMGKIAMQLAVYAHGLLYDPTTHERTALPNVDLDRAIVVHLPAGSGTCELVEVDIARGWQAVTELCGRVRAWRKLRFADLARRIEIVGDEAAAAPSAVPSDAKQLGHTSDVPDAFTRSNLADKIAEATSVERLTDLWREHAHEWGPEHTELAKARKALLAQRLVT